MNYAGVQILRIGKYGEQWYLTPPSLNHFCGTVKYAPVVWYEDEDGQKERQIIGIADNFRIEHKNLVCDIEIIERYNEEHYGKIVFARCLMEVINCEGKGRRKKVNTFGFVSFGLSERPGPISKLKSIQIERKGDRDGK